jgi:Rod binding domain-containing protein
MAIKPPSDIVLEVARAADPQRAAAVAQRLSALATDAPSAEADFTAALEKTRSASPAPVEGAPDMRARIGSAGADPNDRVRKVQVQFEAALLNNFVGEMLPKDAPETYGQGLAGEMWRSLLAEKISNQIAASGALGLGERLFATHPLSASSRLAHATRGLRSDVAEAAQMSANPLSLASGADVADGSILFASAVNR